MFYLSFNSEDPIFGDGVKGVVVWVSVVVSGTAVDSVVVVSLRFGGGGGGEVVMIWSLGGCVVTIASFGSGVVVVVVVVDGSLGGCGGEVVVVGGLTTGVVVMGGFGLGWGWVVMVIGSLGTTGIDADPPVAFVGGLDLTATFRIVAVSFETLKSFENAKI